MTVRPDEANGSSASLNETVGSTRAQSAVSSPQPLAPSRQRLSRRLMLRGAGAALPAMLTLHSGAASALARSSNLISGSGETQPDGTALCLDETAGVPLDDGRIDLGHEGTGTVWEIPGDGQYYAQSNGTEPLTAAEACERSGDLYYASGETFPKAAKVNSGILISATALTSFASRGILNVRNL